MIEPDTLQAVMFAAEASPLAKVGGLADVVGALPKALEKLGVKVTILLPAYKSIHHDQFGIRPGRRVSGFDIQMGPGHAHAEIFEGRLPRSGVELFLIGSLRHFYRDGIYDDPVTKEGYADNMERFVFFQKAGLELLRRLGGRFDVIHCHDSQAGLVPGLMATRLRSDPIFARAGVLFTIHNLEYQGIYPKDSLYWAGIDYRNFYPTSPFEFWGRVNFMKVAIEFADLINTVSENYAREIQSGPEYGLGLDGVLRLRGHDISGIVNGIDYEEWNPETDPLIPAHYSIADTSGKSVCKSELLRQFHLPAGNGTVPLIGMVSRLANQKGFDLFESAADEISRLNVQVVILGRGQRRYHDLLRSLSHRYPNKIGVRLEFDSRIAHMIQAGSDMILMPSRHEPCGLNQLHGLRYGTVPVVRATGGLVDTVEDYSDTAESGTGFRFKEYTAGDMLGAIRRATAVFAAPERWHALAHRGMMQDWSWQNSARKYVQLYQRIKETRSSFLHRQL